MSEKAACRITAVETAIISLPLPRPVITPVHHITTVDNVLVTVRTETGIEGIAYLWCFGERRARVLVAMVQALAEHVLGADARQTSALWDRLWRENNFFGRAGVAMLAHSALDIACWDIKARAVGQPLWQLLGGAERAIPTYAGGLFLSDPLEAIVEEARGYVQQGFTAMKMRAGMPRLADDIARFDAVRQAIGPDIKLMIDAVQAWTPDDAIRACQALAEFDITWIEDPVAFDDHPGLARVAQAVPMPLCAGGLCPPDRPGRHPHRHAGPATRGRYHRMDAGGRTGRRARPARDAACLSRAFGATDVRRAQRFLAGVRALVGAAVHPAAGTQRRGHASTGRPRAGLAI